MQHSSLKLKRNSRGEREWYLEWPEGDQTHTRTLGKFAAMSRTEAEAESQRILGRLNVESLAPRDASALTLRCYIEDRYLTVKLPKWKASTRAITEQMIEQHILDDLGNCTLASITHEELRVHMVRKADAKLSFLLLTHIRRHLAAIFSMAVSDGLTTANPAAELIAKTCVPAGDQRTITADDITNAETELGIMERLIFRLASVEGMRAGEIFGLQVGDLREGKLYIERSVYRGLIDTPKSTAGRRTYTLSQTTAALLAQWIDMAKVSGSIWLFPSEDGETPLSFSNVYRRHIQPALARVGLGWVSFQTLRRHGAKLKRAMRLQGCAKPHFAGPSVEPSPEVKEIV
jgi:integrase